MAILSKIRERSLFLILVIGLALFAFVLDPSTLGDFFNSSKVNEIGEINGESISREEFAKQVDAYKTQMGNRGTEMQAAKSVWNNLVREKIYQQQLENAGISLGEEDVWNEIKKAPFVQNNPQYQTSGIFDENKLKQFLADTKENNPQLWNSWTSYMGRVKQNLERNTYDNLVAAGLGASLLEGKSNYYNSQVKLSGKFTYVPYNTVPDSLVKVSESDVKSYINKHSKDFQVEETRDIAYVKFAIKPSKEDEEAIKKEVASLIEDREEYSNATKGNITIKGLKNSENIQEFFTENKSDTKLNSQFVFKNQLPKEFADKIIEAQEGEVFGPYKNGDYFKIAKVVSIIKMPDSVKASHMLIPFVGSRSATAETKQTEEQAKKTVDSILAVVKKRPSKFEALAKQFSKDKSNAEKGGDLGWFTYNRMMPSFRDFCFEGKKGDIGIVKTPYGFHVIKIEGQKNIQKAIKLAEFGRKIEASEATENTIFQNAEEFSQAVSEDVKKFYATAREKGLNSRSAVGLKMLDENITGLGNERQIVTWAFNSDNKVGAFKRFDIKDGYAVAVIVGKQDKGLMSVKKATSRVKSLLIKEKKAAIINAKMNASTLQDIAKENNTTVRTFNGVSLKSPVLSGVGNEPKVLGAMANATQGKLYNKVDGNRGVFAFELTKVEQPVELPNYASERNRVAEKLKNKTAKMFEALKNASDVEDNRAFYYGIQ